MAITVVKTGKKKDSGRRSINMTRAIKRLGLTPESITGRYELLTRGDDGAELLIVALASVTVEDREREQKREQREQARKAAGDRPRGKG